MIDGACNLIAALSQQAPAWSTDLYDQRIDAMKARERKEAETHAAIVQFTKHLMPPGDLISEQDMRDIERRLAYKRKRTATALTELQRLGQEWDNG